MQAEQLFEFDFEWRPLQNYLRDQRLSPPALPPGAAPPSEALYDWIVGQARSAEEGLQLGRYYNISDYGVIGLALLCAERAADALKVVRAYLLLFNRDIADIRVDRGAGHEVRILISVNHRPGWSEVSQQFHTNVVASASCKLMRDLFGKDFVISGLTLPLHQGGSAGYAGFFGLPVRLRGSDVVFHLPASQLDMPIASANPAVFQAALAMASESFNALLEVEMGGLRPRIVALLDSLPEPYPDIQSVARHLRLTERTLRRRLAAEGCSYRQILDDARQARARKLLRTELPVERISELLGYSDASSFRHAFRRWTGQSVSAFREEYFQASG
ncbi:AraC-like DNA-binding protein [Pseudomonas citronellolis]|uniref:helix-turn-helix transcriptional regulator n=1 Tax=Pseudomonas citronellolis TaxID=53408 RepID=UPI0020A0CEF2|nr:helix-turn-helix domain-containing protein [Pseudomonas citronellolis]MCP1644881.1 AraC-like DNA-binding protein [Pseudomonas citronellolis]MCP1667826.1 AraC-like DNA-binding protein [Pseudomonas citronellolis]MCP1699078.1 AraC-like DNA-binding protein [Pseudomonas citronellolis]MCP1704933.1 AraC-like DNA-binding protein [Pseudomonas citronellolis]MCP1799641.1 AraC-like DNA-binding protein [Pseudomonas citronellolis]